MIPFVSPAYRNPVGIRYDDATYREHVIHKLLLRIDRVSFHTCHVSIVGLASAAIGLVDVAACLGESRRVILGITGPPGSGKSALAQSLVVEINRRQGEPFARTVPADGYHLYNKRLDELGVRRFKGAPYTFDVAAYVAKLQELREGGIQPAWCPRYDRYVIHDPVEDAIEIPAGTRIVVTEGNYLLLDDCGWGQVRQLLDAVWYVDVSKQVAEPRLLARHRRSGNDEATARWRVNENDLVNFDLVESCRGRANRFIAQSEFEPLATDSNDP
jgi:pantothenate kinase